MEIIILSISVVTLVIAVLLLVKSRQPDTRAEDTMRFETAVGALRQEMTNTVTQSSTSLAASLSGLIAGSGADMRQEVSDRISDGMGGMTRRVEERLAQGREESARLGAAANEALMNRLSESGDKTELRIAALEKRTAESLEAIRGKVDERLAQIGMQVQEKLDRNIKDGFAHFEKVQEHLKRAEAQLISVAAVGASVNELNSLLKLPHLRGGFGEAALELMLHDILPSGLYELQAQVVPNSQERVDALVKLPGANLPIDSKFPREQVLPLFESGEAAGLAEARKTLSRVIRDQAKDIAAKYIRPEHGTTDMALMFLPSETLYFEVVRDAELWAALQKMKIYPVSPNTLAVTLKGVALSYDYYAMAKGVEKTVEDIKKARRHFEHFSDKFESVGTQLDRAREAYRTAGTHLGRYSSSLTRLTGHEAAPELPDETQ